MHGSYHGVSHDAPTQGERVVEANIQAGGDSCSSRMSGRLHALLYLDERVSLWHSKAVPANHVGHQTR